MRTQNREYEVAGLEVFGTMVTSQGVLTVTRSWKKETVSSSGLKGSMVLLTR